VDVLRTVVGDALFGLRMFARKPGFAAVAVLALALGIAVNTAMFSVVHATLLAPLPYPEPDRLVTVWPSSPPGQRSVFAPSAFLDLKRDARSFEQLHAWTGREVSLGIGDGAEAVSATVATPGYLSMMGAGMTLGRDFLPEEGTVGRDRVAILAHRLWQERFGGDRGILGRTVRIDRVPHVIVGVQAPADSRAILQPKLVLPLAFTDEQVASPYYLFLLSMARLKPGVTVAQASAEATAVWARVNAASPSLSGAAIEVVPLQTSFIAEDRVRALWLLMGAVGCVLLIACANVANLLLARGAGRRREVSLRASLGASRRRILAQFLAESAALAVVGGLLGTGLAFAFVRIMQAVTSLVAIPDFALSGPVLVFTAAVTVAATFLFGSVPAWAAMRTNPLEGLKDGGYATIGARRKGGRRVLVAAEVALALTLLAVGALVVSDLVALARVDLGLRHDRLLTFRLDGPGDRAADADRVDAFYRRVVEGLRALPAVETVGLSAWLPLQGAMFGRSFEIAGHPNGRSERSASFNMVTPGYFDAYGIAVLRGRGLSEQDRAGATLAAVVDETFVRRYLGGLDPLQQRLVISHAGPGQVVASPAETREWQIVGVRRDTRSTGPGRSETQPTIDVPFAQSPWTEGWIAIRTKAAAPETLRPSVAAVLGAVERDLVMHDVQTMDERYERTIASERFNATLFGTFAAMALLLAALGVYGVTSFSVAQRTREIGLRMALGADRARVLWSVVREGMVTVLAGTAVGACGSFAATRAMRGMVHGVRADDPTPIVAVIALLLAVALVACVVPARRAAGVDPLVALRED
jgi:putative ABC transport system permease protein